MTKMLHPVDETVFGPDSVFTVTFGPAHRASLPMLLVAPSEKEQLMHGSGRFAGLKGNKEISNGELYRYLRLGVGLQSAMSLKVLGYLTPESLTDSPVVSPMLPDHLAYDGVVQMEVIDRCESEGVSALECQFALRRGLCDDHLDKALSLRQLVSVFRNYGSGRGKNAADLLREPLAVDYLCEAIVPFDLLASERLNAQTLMTIGKRFKTCADEPTVQSIRNDVDLFERFTHVIALSAYQKSAVSTLFDLVRDYGIKVLDLDRPFHCGQMIEDEYGKHPVGLETTRFIDEIVSLREPRTFYHLRDNGLIVGDITLSNLDLERMRLAGLRPEEVTLLVLKLGMTPSAAIVVKEDDIHSALMIGAL